VTNRPISPCQPEPIPFRQAELDRRRRLLIDHLGFTVDEAASYLNGDQGALDAVTSRRKQAADALLMHQRNENVAESL
jgi:hypothetical protein